MKQQQSKLLNLGFLCCLLALADVSTASGAEPATAATTAAPATAANRDSKPIENTDIRRILQAMQDADAPMLIQLYQSASDPIVHIWAAMALERVHFNLDAATTDASLCEKALLDSHPGIALLCGQFQSGNLRLAGRQAEADSYEKTLIERYQNHGVDRQLAGMQGYEDRQTSLAKLAIDRPATDITLPLKDDKPSPTFDAKANGHAFELTLDSGASNLVLGEEDAHKFGVKLFDRPVGHVNGWLSQGVPAQHGLLEKLQIGAITLRNVPVTVVPRQIALLGANMIAPLGTLRVSHSSLLLYGNQSNAPACDTPMLVGTDLWGNSLRILPQLLVNDMPRSVMLDTGASRYLLGTKAALDEVTVLHRGKLAMGDIGGRHAFANAESAKVRLTIAGQPIEMYFAVYTDSDSPHGITLGAGALRDMDFLLDFQHQHMCLLLHPDLH